MQDEREQRPLRSVPDIPAPTESADAILPGPRVGELDALLREVDGLRLTLETDLTLMAAAVESGRPELAVELIDTDRAALQGFEARALGHLAELSAPAAAKGSRWTRITAAPFVAAAALVGLLVGVVPTTFNGPEDLASTAVSAQSSLNKLTTLAAQGETSQVRDTAETLHEQIEELVALSGDPAAARQALFLLHQERVAIVQSGDGAILHDVLAEAHAIATRIARTLPASTIGPLPLAPPPAQPRPTQSSSPTPRQTTSTAKPSPTASPKPKPSPTASPKPKATSSPKATPSPTASPTAGNTGASSPYPVPPAPLG